jgi:hypothetical protein
MNNILRLSGKTTELLILKSMVRIITTGLLNVKCFYNNKLIGKLEMEMKFVSVSGAVSR